MNKINVQLNRQIAENNVYRSTVKLFIKYKVKHLLVTCIYDGVPLCEHSSHSIPLMQAADFCYVRTGTDPASHNALLETVENKSRSSMFF